MTTVGSLFSGIGGLDLGVELAVPGARVLWQAESDPDAVRVLERWWPEARRYRDVRQVAEGTARVDIVCGGFPCQDVSVAGTGVGLDGERSGLWREFARVVRVLRPSVVFVENVPPLASRGLDEVLRDLAACGLDAEWDLFRASDVGAPHKRERLFVLAYSDSERVRQLSERDQRRGGRVREAECWDAEPVPEGAPLADAARSGRSGTSGRTEPGGRPGAVGRGDPQDVVDAARDGRREGVAEPAGRAERPPVGSPGDPVDVADADGRGRQRQRQQEPGGVEGARGRLADRRGHDWREHRFPPGPDEIHGWDGPQPAVRRSAARVPVGLDGRWRAKNGTADRLRLLGNAVVPQCAALAWRTLAARVTR